MEVVRGEPHERLDEPPRAGRAVDLVGVVEHEQQLVVAGVLERVRDERRGGLAPLLRLRVVARVDRGRDRRGEVLGERLGQAPQRATTPAANVPRWRSIASTVYQAVFRVRATRAARVLFPNPAPATMIVSRRSVPAASRASSSGRSRVPLGSRGGTSLAARLMPIAGGRVAAVGAVLRSSAVPSGMAPAW